MSQPPNGNNVPANVRGLAYMISTVGFPILAALLAFAVWAGWVPSPIIEARDKAVAAANAIQEMKGSVEDSVKAQVFILRRICRNTAKSRADDLECDR